MKTLEKIKESNARYRAENPEKVKESKARYRAKNREKIKEFSTRYYEEHFEKIKEYKARYRAENPEKIKEEKSRYILRCNDSYVKSILQMKNAPPELIELKREQMLNKRILKQLMKEVTK